jgi:hypothetical protein
VTIYDPDLVSDDPTLQRIDWLLKRTGDELRRAVERFPAFNSPHEGWAVIHEELDEMWDHCRANTGRSPDAHREAIQVAAMALRYVMDCRE